MRSASASTVLIITALALAGCVSTTPPPDNGNETGDQVRVASTGRNPTRELTKSDLPPAPPAVGVETVSVTSYVHEPAATYRQAPATEALAEAGVDIQPMDREVPLNRSGRGRTRNAGGNSGSLSLDASPSAALASPAFPASIDAPPEPPLAPPALSTNFGSIDYETNLTENSNFAFIPPDPDAAAGPNHVVAVVNTVIQFQEKNGTVVFTDSLKDFFSAETPQTFTFDPKVLFDPFEGRFVVVTLEREDDGAGPNPEKSEIFLAVSDDADPLGVWCTTTIVANTMIPPFGDQWADYPGFAVDEEAVYITANMFDFTTPGFSNGVRLWVVDKGVGTNGLYDCGTAIVSKFDPYAPPPLGSGGSAVTTQPAQIHGPAPTGVGTFLVGYSGLTDEDDEFVQVVRIDSPLGIPTFTQEFINVGDIEPFPNALNDAPQFGSGALIETNDRRALDAEWFDDSLWMTATIQPSTGADANERTAHWWQLDTSVFANITLTDQGDISGDDLVADLFTFFPSVAVNGAGQAGFGYSGSADSVFASSYYTGRNPGDAAGSTQGTALLQGGVAPYFRQFCGSKNRWGDYSSAETDPVDGCFWFYNEHAWTTGNNSTCGMGPTQTGRWETHYGKMCPAGACTADMWLEDIDLSGIQTRKAASAIRTGGGVTVKAAADVTFQAEDLLVFFNGLTVESTGVFTASLTANPCL